MKYNDALKQAIAQHNNQVDQYNTTMLMDAAKTNANID
jgi:hypothetical protein